MNRIVTLQTINFGYITSLFQQLLVRLDNLNSPSMIPIVFWPYSKIVRLVVCSGGRWQEPL